MNHTITIINDNSLSRKILNYFPEHEIVTKNCDDLQSYTEFRKDSIILVAIPDLSRPYEEMIELLLRKECLIKGIVFGDKLAIIDGNVLEYYIAGHDSGIFLTMSFLFPDYGKMKLFHALFSDVTPSIQSNTIPTNLQEILLKRELDPQVTMIGTVLTIKMREIDHAAIQEKELITSSFIDMFSHDIGLPLTSLKSNIENLLEGEFGDLDEKKLNVISNLKNNVEKINDIRKEALMLNKLDSGTYTMKKSLTNVHGLLEEIMYQVMPISDRKLQDISLNSPHFSASIDKSKIKHVIDNLVSNAIKYTPQKGEVEIIAEKGSKSFRIIVMDTGVGIPSGMEEKIFDRFVRCHKDMGEGTGLGLSIVKMIVEKHGGKVWVENRSSGGSKFIVELPKK